MEQVIERIKDWKDSLAHDPLYREILLQNRESELFSIEDLNRLENKRWYSTAEVSEFIGITDANLRYYIQKFVPYLFTEDSPSTGTFYRLDGVAAIKLKMIIMLKDQQKVTGLKRLLGLSEGYVIEDEKSSVTKQQSKNTSSPPADINLVKRVAYLENMVGSLLQSELFMIDKDENDQPVIRFRDSAIEDRMQKYLGTDNREELNEKMDVMDKRVGKLSEENQELKKLLKEQKNDIYDRTNRDVAKQIAHQQIENTVRHELRAEAVEEWNSEKRYGMIASITKRQEIEKERERFINSYIDQRLPQLTAERIAAYEYPNDLEENIVENTGPA